MAVPIVEWIAADGTTTTLNVEWGTSGTGLPGVRLDEQGVPGQPGARLREVLHDVREFTLPVNVHDVDDPDAHYAALRALLRDMDPARGVGRVRITSPLGDQREISCITVAGLGIDTGSSTSWYQKLPIVFRAHDPYWYASEIVAEYTSGDRPNFFPFFPLRLSSSEVFADITVDNTGDVESWPVWEVEGPGSDIILRNLTTEKSITLSTSLLAGETIEIDTRPGFKTVIQDGTTNLWPSVSLDSALWSLTPGANAVRLEMGGGGDDSIVRLRFRPRYLSA